MSGISSKLRVSTFATALLLLWLVIFSVFPFSGIFGHPVSRLLFSFFLTIGGFNLLLYVIGFWQWFQIRIERTLSLSRRNSCSASIAVTTRTAIVMPVYHEEMERIYADIRRTLQSIKGAELANCCNFYLLCDSTDPEICAQEEAVCQRLRGEFETGDEASISCFLVRRPERKNFKAGNIMHFLEKHGSSYDYMLVLDADSVMLGSTIKRLLLRMQASPNVAILQSIVLPRGTETLFGRATQYATVRCTPLFAIGMYWVLGKQSVYWGHNALIRIKPFIEYGRLPVLPGKPPLGGTIMSQDIVEAALLGRAGWDVEWDVEGSGSYDQLPANLISYGQRDRRWCQGNFQHYRFIFARGIKLGHRLYFANGILCYLGGPCMLLFIAGGFIDSLIGINYGTSPAIQWSLPSWMLMLILPRILGLIYASSIRKLNWPKELLSSVLESVLSVLWGACLFFLHTRFVSEILLGKMVSWKNQCRNPRDQLAWGTAARIFGPCTFLATLWLILGLWINPAALVYSIPVLTGWLFSIPLAVWTSSATVGDWLAKFGLFPELLTEAESRELTELNKPKDEEIAAVMSRQETSCFPINAKFCESKPVTNQ